MFQPRARLSEEALGKRVLFLVAGRRGAVQPLVALAAGCKRAGFEVLVAAHGHTGFFEDFGLEVVDCAETGCSGEESDGSGRSAGSGSSTRSTASPTILGPSVLRSMFEYCMDFRPELILSGPPCLPAAHAFADRLGVPAMECTTQVHTPSCKTSSPYGEPEGMPGFLHYLMWMAFMRDVFRQYEQTQLPILDGMLQTFGSMGVWSCMQMYLLDTQQPIAAGPFAVSPALAALPGDAPKELSSAGPPTGLMVISRQEQLTKADDMFGCRSVLRAFIDADPADKPIYMGFGPEVGSGAEALTTAAVEAAYLLKRRAVVLCGAAGLGHASLRCDPELQAYCAKGVIFVHSAPHEWLFPRCSAVVHHGGSGTTGCALRAGVPSVVAPSTPDQQVQERLVRRLACGTGAGPLRALSGTQLARVLSAVLKDQASLEACKDLGARLQKEDGVKASIEHIDRFFQEKVATGEFSEAREKRQREKQALRTGAHDGCLAWVARLVCGRSRTDFAPRLGAK